MSSRLLRIFICLGFGSVSAAYAQQSNACSALAKFTIPGTAVVITKAQMILAGPAPAIPRMPSYNGLLPAHCRVDGVINHRTGVEGKEFGIGFALALPENWNHDFMMQGGAGANGFIAPPVGGQAAGKTPGLVRGFAVASTDTGHTTSGAIFDFSFMKDQQAALDFAYLANAEVADVAKQIIVRYYGKPASYSYFVGCSTGGREGMILTQRYPTAFNGIVSGDPAIRTGFSAMAADRWSAVSYNQIAPRDASGKPITSEAISDVDRKVIRDALLKRCDELDGLADGMISDPLACHFDPAELICKGTQTDSCITADKAAAIKKVFGGPRDSRGFQVYPGYLYDTGNTDETPIPGLLAMRVGPIGVPSSGMELDVDKEALTAPNPLVDSLSTNLTTFSANGGKIIFYHGVSDPWFSALDTLQYYRSMADDNGGLEKVTEWSQMYLVPGMSHCEGGLAALDQFDMLSAVVNWTEKGIAPESVIAIGKALPGRSRPLCPYPEHTHYKGKGNTEDAESFECRP